MGEGIDPRKWVVDCSFTSALFLPDEASTKVMTFFSKVIGNEDKLLVPGLWTYETGNVLVSALKRGRISITQKQEILNLLEQLPFDHRSFSSFEEVSNIISLARQLSLSYYDASYLYLAIFNSCGLASLDQKLIQAASTAGVTTALI